MENFSADLPHLYAEGIDYSEEALGETSYPNIVEYSVGTLDVLAEDFDGADGENSVLHLYRGDSRENLEELEGANLESLKLTEDITKEFPLYFTTSEAEARDHAERKPTDDRYLLKLDVPFESLDRISDLTPLEVARNFDKIDFQKNSMYFNQSNNN